MIIQPKIRGFICTTAHPQGCAENVNQQIAYVKSQSTISNGPKNVLVIGASTGYGLASRIVASFGASAKTIGVFFEKPASGKRTATAGWYNSAAFERAAAKQGLYAKSINGDAFSDAIKQKTIELIKQDLSKIDCVIYSLASPRRTDPKTGETFNAVLKPINKTYTNKTVNVMTGKISDISIEPADDNDINNTIKVMGGEDWSLWIEALLKTNVLAKNVLTIAYSYIGTEITFSIYRNGTIGKAKENLENTVTFLNEQLKEINGHALVSVNKGLVTQSSAAIPVVPLYISSLYKIMKAKKLHEGCIEQIQRLFAERLYINGEIPVDEKGRIRIDDWEMRDDVQAEISEAWQQINTENLTEITDIEGYRKEFYQLFGFEFDDIDYDKDINPDVEIPSIKT